MSSTQTEIEQKVKKRKECYFVFFYPPKFIRVPVCDLISETTSKDVVLLDQQWPSHNDLLRYSICTTSPKLGSSLFTFPDGYPSYKKMSRHDLGQIPTSVPTNCKMAVTICREMPVEITGFLSVQIGEYIYVLSSNEDKTLVCQRYDIDNNSWYVYTSQYAYTGHKCGGFSMSPSQVAYNIGTSPHVVIKHKLHVSVGCNCCFHSFDTKNGTWERSNLFSTFDGRGLLLDDNKFLATYRPIYSIACHLVAFLLDGDGSIIGRQLFDLEDRKLVDVRLVDFGRDGYIGLVHLQGGRGGEYLGRAELVTFKYSRLEPPRNGEFLKLECVQTYLLGKEKFSRSLCSNAYCV